MSAHKTESRRVFLGAIVGGFFADVVIVLSLEFTVGDFLHDAAMSAVSIVSSSFGGVVCISLSSANDRNKMIVIYPIVIAVLEAFAWMFFFAEPPWHSSRHLEFMYAVFLVLAAYFGCALTTRVLS